MRIRTESDVDHQATGAVIERELLDALRSSSPQATNATLVITARNDADEIIGGVTGSTSYGWLNIKTLWVHDDHRGQRIGRELVAAIEEKSHEKGCHGAWLDTSSEDARQFYAGLGYQPFGQLANQAHQHPVGHRRWFLRRLYTNRPDDQSGR